MQPGSDLSLMAPVWREALRREGLTSPQRVALWLDERRETPLPPQHVEMVLRRVRGTARLVDLASEDELGVAHGQVQGQLHAAALRLLVPHLGDVAAWARARASGVGDEVVAGPSGTYPEVVALALDGWPARERVPSVGQVVEAYRAWVAGAGVAEVAGVLGMSSGQLRRGLVDGSSRLPRRLYARDVSARFGWSPSTVSRHRRAGVLPAADGVDGSRQWWWESTIEGWASQRTMHECRSCGACYLTRGGLRGT